MDYAERNGSLLGTTGADAALFAGEGDEELVVAVGAADTGESMLEIAALNECSDRLVDDGSPEAELAGVLMWVGGAKVIEVFAEQATWKSSSLPCVTDRGMSASGARECEHLKWTATLRRRVARVLSSLPRHHPLPAVPASPHSHDAPRTRARIHHEQMPAPTLRTFQAASFLSATVSGH